MTDERLALSIAAPARRRGPTHDMGRDRAVDARAYRGDVEMAAAAALAVARAPRQRLAGGAPGPAAGVSPGATVIACDAGSAVNHA